ncbi:hypothetical protein P3W85_14960, partial [Cupriavidus basilensis]
GRQGGAGKDNGYRHGGGPGKGKADMTVHREAPPLALAGCGDIRLPAGRIHQLMLVLFSAFGAFDAFSASPQPATASVP